MDCREVNQNQQITKDNWQHELYEKKPNFIGLFFVCDKYCTDCHDYLAIYLF